MSLSPQAQFIIGPQAPIGNSWFDQTQVSIARMLGQQCPAVPPTEPAQLDGYLKNLQYYDLGKSLYTVYERTGDPAFRDYAIKAIDSWWQYPDVGRGLVRPWPDVATPQPRHAGIGGLILRALDGKPEYWDFCVEYTRAFLNIYMLWRLNNEKIHVDIREGAFTFHYATWLAKVLPDSYPKQAGGIETNGAAIRAEFHAKLETITIQYYERLQKLSPCGSCWLYDAEIDGQSLRGFTQPFTAGLLLLAFADFHQITTNATVRESLGSMILKAARHLYVDGPYRLNDPVPYDPSKRWRCFWYLWHGGTLANPTAFERGGWSLPGNNKSEVQDGRQSIGPVIAIYGYAHKISGVRLYLDALNELWDSAYGDTDGIRNYMNTDGKGFNQNCARAGSGPVWAGISTVPTPSPSPIPQPPPAPTKPPSPDGTKATTVIDSQGATWTLGPEKQTLRDGAQVGNGAGSIYKYQNSVVHVLGTNDRWYRWTGTSWSEIGAQEPGGSVPVPTPTPTPLPTPSPIPNTRVVPYPKQASKRNLILDAQWKERYRLKAESETTASAVFEMVI